MAKISRRKFIFGIGGAAMLSLTKGGHGAGRLAAQAKATQDIYIARNGTPVSNVQEVLRLAGGIESFIGPNDVVVLKPNGQWSRQGYTHTECMKALIDVILARPGGFSGEVIIAEHIQRTPAQAMGPSYCWNIAAGNNRTNNWPDMSYLQLVAHYAGSGHANVTAVPLYNVIDDPDHWAVATGPANIPADKHGWVRLPLYTAANGRTITPSYPILRSAYSGKLVDIHRGGGVWESGGYNGQAVRLIFLPTLNNHGFGGEDYAGITSAVKCHIGFQEATSLHSVGYGYSRPDCVGEAVGHLITQVFAPTFYMTCAEYSGHESRTGAATQTRTVGLCADPVTLDYWMSKYVLYPCNNAAYFNPDNDNNTRSTLLGCMGKGVGTVNESEIRLHLSEGGSQSIALISGWNWISSHRLPADYSLDSIFAGILDQVEQVKTQTQSAMHSAGIWKGDLTDMSGIGLYKMFKVKVSAARTLTITGTTIPPTTPIALQTGWNWVAFLPTTSMPIATALDSIKGQVQEVKSLTQLATYSGSAWSGTLTQLAPGQGYAIKMSGPGTLTYPAS